MCLQKPCVEAAKAAALLLSWCPCYAMQRALLTAPALSSYGNNETLLLSAGLCKTTCSGGADTVRSDDSSAEDPHLG